MMIEMTTSRIAAASPPGDCVKLKMAMGSVLVSPGMFETNVIVAPNSPKARAKVRIEPARIPD